MQLWRVSRHKTLDGVGGLLVEGRWHTRGRPIVYCSSHPSLALVEWIVRLELEPDEIPDIIPYIVVDLPDDVADERVDAARLPTDWKNNLSGTQTIGDEWLISRRTAVLRVPSAVAPESENVLINPLHAGATRIRIVRTLDEPFDPRLLAGRV